MLGADDGLSALRKLASDPADPKARSLALAYLGQLKDSSSRPVFLAGLKDLSVLIRAHSIYGLGFVGGVEDIPAIEAGYLEAKRNDTNLVDDGGSSLIDETVREAIETIRKR